MLLLARYRDVLRGDGVAAALAFSLIGRLSLGMTGLALVLLVRETTGSYAAAGLVSAAYALAFAVGSPARARSADRSGPVTVLVRCAVVHPVLLCALSALADRGAGLALLLVLATAAGLTVPPLGAVMRALWGDVLRGQILATAYSLEAVAIELCFVVGPVLTAGLVVASGPGAALVASAGLTLIGGAGLGRGRAVRAVRPHPDAVHTFIGPLVSSSVRALLLTVVWIGAGFGAIEVALPAFAESQGSRPAAAGVLLAVWGLGSAVGGLLYGGLRVDRPAVEQLPWLVTALAVGAVLPLLAGGTVAMGVALFCFGLTIAPLFACNSMLLGGAAPTGTATEAFAWNSSMIFGGAAAGTAIAGVLVEASGPTAALAVCTVAAALALATSLAGLRTLRSAEG